MSSQSRGSYRVGTSGWVYKHWLGIFYPNKMVGDRQLQFYSERFDTVEVNYSFYRLPERKVFEKWAAESPANFLFAVKGSRYLTHIKKLADPEEPLQRLMDRASGLGEKLGPILFQFSPNWKLDLDRLRHFVCSSLVKYPDQRFAFEFRHKTWLTEEVFELLRESDAALVMPVRAGQQLTPTMTANWSYIRMHEGTEGGNFTHSELESWSRQINSWLSKGADVFVYFNNDWEGFALDNAKTLLRLLESERTGR